MILEERFIGVWMDVWCCSVEIRYLDSFLSLFAILLCNKIWFSPDICPFVLQRWYM